jgi:EmrB/QacA subfamily drug resistance transporter
MITTTQIKNRRIEANEGRRLKIALLVIATAQLMFVLDDAIANIALPSIQREMSVPSLTLPWIINAYILAFGGLLLFGGRVGDLYGRRKIFRIGLIVFAFASLLGGIATNVNFLIAARGLQGIGAALAAPNALALIATNFPIGKSRNSAMGVYGAMSALGIIVGVLLGGFLTATLGWRWVFFINVPIALAVLGGTNNLVEGQRSTGKLDFLGAVSGVIATVTFAYGITRGGEHGWSDPTTLGGFAIAVVMAMIFIFLQKRSRNPILPLSLFKDLNRSGSYLAMLIVGAGLMGTGYLLTLYLQEVLHFSPLKTGFSFLPFGFGIIFGSVVSSKLAERFAPRSLAAPGLLIATIGMYWLSTLSTSSSFATHVLPAVFITTLGLGVAAVTLTLTAVHRVAEQQTGVASALVNMAQQVGSALGISIFTTVATSVANEQLPDAVKVLQKGLENNDKGIVAKASEALSNGYTSAYFAGGILLLIAAVVVLVMITTKHRQSETKTEEAV